MNERFEDLDKQTTDICTDLFERGIGYNRQQIFAELIVNTAVELVRDVTRDEYSAVSWTACKEIQTRLREYFGVTE